MACIIINNKVKDLAKTMGENPVVTANKIGIWQEQNNITDLDKFPTEEEYKSINIKEPQTVNNLNRIKNAVPVNKVDLDFTATERKDRVTLLARLFSDTLDNAVQDHLKELNDNLTEAISLGDDKTAGAIQESIDNISRMNVLNTLSPRGVWNKLKNDYFDDYLKGTHEDRVAAERAIIDSENMDDPEYKEEERQADAEEWATYKENHYKKIVDNFEALANEASRKLVFAEGIKVDPGSISANTVQDEDIKGEEVSENADDNKDSIPNKEEGVKDNWMYNFREVSSRSSLSKTVRSLIRQMIKLDENGFAETDDLGNIKYLDPDYVHAVLIDNLRFMNSREDMLPLLDKLSNTKPWVKQVIKRVTDDPTVFTAFYNDFNKHFQPFWIQKKVLQKDGSYKFTLQPCNKPEGTYYTLDEWRDTINNREPLSDKSLYIPGKDGNYNTELAKQGLTKLQELQSSLESIGRFEVSKINSMIADNTDNLTTDIMNLLKGIGINPNQSVLTEALTGKEYADMKMVHPIFDLLGNINTIYKDFAENKVKAFTEREDGSRTPTDLINEYSTRYNRIAKMLASVTSDAIESSFRENGNTYYSHVVPSYMNKLISNLKDVTGKALGDSSKFTAYIEDQFKKYEWFYKNGKYLNSWIDELVNNPEAREVLEHKVLLNSGKINYEDWDDRDTAVALLNEYLSDANAHKGGKTTAWYHVPILSDTFSSEFIKFYRYTNANSGIDETGKDIGYHKVISDKLKNIIIQEFGRINQVLARDYDFTNNPNTKVVPIANYDIVRDKSGKIKSIGGAEFKFFLELNDIKLDNGDTFLEAYSRIINEPTNTFNADEFINRAKEGNADLADLNTSNEKVEALLDTAINTIMNQRFDSFLKQYRSYGIFETNEQGTKYKYLPYESQSKINQNNIRALEYGLSNISMTEENRDRVQSLLNSYKDGSYIDRPDIEDIFNTLKEDANLKDKAFLDRNLSTRNYAVEALEEYFWNSQLATSQIIQLATTDLAFYKNMDDFQKRFKEVHAPSNKLDTEAMWNGVKVGRDNERTIYLTDDEITSEALTDIKEILDHKVSLGQLSKFDRDDILNKFQEINVADAQAFRSLSSYRAVQVMAHQWSDEAEQAYKNFLANKWNANDFNVIWQTTKPFLYTQVANDNGLTGQPIKTPVQHKNSEFLLLAMHNLVAGTLGKSEKLRAINEFMEKNNVDVVQFESAVKAGKQGLINLNNLQASGKEEVNGNKVTFKSYNELKSKMDNLLSSDKISQEDYNRVIAQYQMKSYKDVMDTLNNKTGILTDGIGNPNVIHSVSYSDYGIQTQTPEHHLDAEQLVGTQIRKLIDSDIADDAMFNINGKSFTKDELHNLYNELNVENILRSYEGLNKEFSTIENVERLLQNTINGSERYSLELAKGLKLNDNGEFILPPCDPSTTIMVQNLINSIIKDRVTKQKIRGGAVIQVSCYGAEDLHIVYDGEGKNKRIKYLECRLPWYTRQYVQPLMNRDHTLDINKVPEDLRKLIGYRIPTEDKYSMAPLYIKEFLPQQNGSAIQLPAEITTLSGSDFDVDKMYLMIPSFNLKYNLKQAWKDFYNSVEGSKYRKAIDAAKNTSFDLFKNQYSEEELNGVNEDSLRDAWEASLKEQGLKDKSFVEGISKAFNPWFKIRKESYINGIEKADYDYNKPAKEQSKAQRDNAMIDIMQAILTHPDTASKILNPGGFDYVKRAARVVTILENVDSKSLIKELKVKTLDNVYDKLNRMTLKDLTDLSSKYKGNIDPMSPNTLIKYHAQNMTGKKLIAIYANQNANHALMQHTNLEVSEAGAFTLNGHKYTSLHGVTNNNGEFISKNTANYLAASADTAKDPVLADISQNLFTADATCLLSRLGYNPIEVGVLLRQPIVQDIIDHYTTDSRLGKWKDTIIEEVLNDYRDIANSYGNHEPFMFENKQFPLSELMDNIVKGKEGNPNDAKSYFINQVNVGLLFQQIMKTADALSKVVQATRADTQGGGAGPTIADTIKKVDKIEDLREKSSKDDFPLANVGEILPISDNGSIIDDIRDKAMKTQLPYIQVFHDLGLVRAENIFNKFMPYYNESFVGAVNDIATFTRSGNLDVRTINSVYNDLFTYLLGNTEFFGNEKDDKGNLTVTASQKRDYFINKFPHDFKRIVSDNPDIASLGLIKRLRVVKPNKGTTVSTLIFKNVGNLSPELKEEYSKDWESLLHSNNPEAIQLALNLMRYNYFRNGFAFGPSTFSHLAPTSLKLSIPDYRSTLLRIQNDKDSVYPEFAHQYILNHLNNRSLVPEINENSGINFLDKDKKPLNTIKINVTTDNKNNFDFRKVIKSENNIFVNGTVYKEYTFMPCITTRINNENIYYVLMNDNGTYTRVNPLGSPNNFLEYEYGKVASEIKTQVPSKVEAEEDFYNTIDENNAPVISEYREDKTNQTFIDSLMNVYDRVEPSEDMDVPPLTELDKDGNPLKEAKDIEPKDIKDDNNEEICHGGNTTIMEL